MAECEKRVDPRSMGMTWQLCVDCEKSEGTSWGADAKDGKCFVHLDAFDRELLLRVAMKHKESLDARGCTVPTGFSWGRRAAALPGIRLDGGCLLSADFSGRKIEGTFSARSTVFQDSAKFQRVRFAKTATFERAMFCGDCDFDSAEFAQWAVFTEAEFQGTALFRGTEFSTGWFDSAIFRGDLIMPDATFGETAWFLQTRFEQVAGFWRCRFERDLLLDDSRFETSMPHFDAAHIENVAIDSYEALVGWRWPSDAGVDAIQLCAASHDGSTQPSLRHRRRSFIASTSSRGVRTLRKSLEDSRNEVGAHLLYEIEMACRSRELRESDFTARRVGEQLTILGFRATSGYGIRPLRVVLWLAALICVATSLLAAHGYVQGSTVNGQSGRTPTQSAQGAAGGMQTERRPALDAVRAVVPGWRLDESFMTATGHWTVTISRIVGIVLLGLLGLSVRNQVKR